MLQKIKPLIEENAISFATVNPDGSPNVIGVAYVKVVSENQLLITDNYMTQTKENLAKEKRVCLAVWDEDWHGYKLIGEAEYYTSGKWFEFVKNLEENKNEPCNAAIIVTVNRTIKLG